MCFCNCSNCKCSRTQNNATEIENVAYRESQCLMVQQDPATTELSPSPVPPSRDLARSAAEDASPNYNSNVE
ncbi:hypothetical protein SLA2020_271160 [Shorea laevis]